MRKYLIVLSVCLSSISWAAKSVDSNEEAEMTTGGDEQWIVHSESNGTAVVSLPPGLSRSKIRFSPRVENGTVLVYPRRRDVLTLPNPQIKINLAKVRSFTLESNDQDVRAFLAETLKLYYVAYQEQFLAATKIDGRFSPLEPMLSVALYDVQKMSLDKVIAIEKRLLSFKSALDSEAARFYAHNYNVALDVHNLNKSQEQILKRLQQLETGRYFGKSLVPVKAETLLNISAKNLEVLLFVSLALSLISIGLVVSERKSK